MRLSADTMRLIAEEEAMMQEYQRQCIMAQQNAGVVERRFSQKVQEQKMLNYKINGKTGRKREPVAANLYPDLSAMQTVDLDHVKEDADIEDKPTTSFSSNYNEATSSGIELETKVVIARDREVLVLKKHLTDFKELYNKNYHEINELRQRNHALMQETDQLRRELGIYEKNVESLTEQNNELKEEKATLFRKLAYCKLKLNKWRARRNPDIQRSKEEKQHEEYLLKVKTDTTSKAPKKLSTIRGSKNVSFGNANQFRKAKVLEEVTVY